MLLVEDNLIDARLAREGVEKFDPSLEVIVCQYGEEAIERVMGKDARAPSVPPNLILLDLNLPRLDGRSVLTALKTHPDHCHIPVIVLTTSMAPEDIRESYRLRANAYLVKPFDVDELHAMLYSTCEYWLRVVTLPVI